MQNSLNFSNNQARHVYRELDDHRKKWFSALIVAASTAWPHVPLNRRLDLQTVVAVPPNWDGAAFGFQQLSGETAEATVMCWQFSHVMKYVMERTKVALDSVMVPFVAVLEPN